MVRFPSLEEYLAAFKQNRLVFLTALILGLVVGFGAGSLWDKASRDLMAEQLTQAGDREVALKSQIEQAQTTHEADTVKIAQQQSEIEKLTTAAKPHPTNAPSNVPRVEVSKMTFHLPDASDERFFFNYWISNKSDVIIKGVVPEASQGFSDHLLKSGRRETVNGCRFWRKYIPDVECQSGDRPARRERRVVRRRVF